MRAGTGRWRGQREGPGQRRRECGRLRRRMPMRMRGGGRPSTGIARRGNRVHARPKGGRGGARR
eukprot:1040600-Prymnesium_polylepis.1